MPKYSIVHFFSCTCATALMAGTASAQDSVKAAGDPPTQASGVQLEEIVVTAQKRAQNLQDVPVAVSAFTGDSLASRGITNIRELNSLTPGLQIAQGTGVALPFLRGIGSNASAVGNESSVAVYTDGLYFTRLPQGFLSLNNIERVEVLKGPQGTLFGRNSSGGVINIVTPDPSFDFQGHGSAGLGRFDTFQGNIYLTGGLSDKVAIDLSTGGTYQRKGWGRNILTGRKVGFQNDFTARSKLLFQPGETTKFVLTGYYAYSRVSTQGNTFPGYTRGTYASPYILETTLPNFYDVASGVDGRNQTSGWGVSLRATQDIGSDVTLTSITGYTHEKELQPGDVDQTARPDGNYALHMRVNQVTQEFQLNGKSGPLTWVTGLFYYNAVSEYNPSDFTGTLFTPRVQLFAKQKAESYAAYGQATYEILPRLSLTAGLRFTNDKVSGNGRADILDVSGNVIASFPTPPDSKTINRLTYRGAIDYKFTDNILSYFSYSRGYKSGGYNLIPFSAPPQRPETVDAFELGFKSDLFDRRLRFNMAAFYYKVADPQVQLIRTGSIVLSNAESSRVKGIEFETQAVLAEGFNARAGLTYLDAKYKRYGYIDPISGACIDCAPSGPPNPNPPYGAVEPLIDVVAGGNRLPMAAKLIFNIGADYTLKTSRGDFQWSVDFYHNSGYFYEPDNLLEQGAYDLLNAHFKYSPTEDVAIRFWGKNLLDKKYISLGITQAGPPGYPFIAGAPRTYGIAVDFKF